VSLNVSVSALQRAMVCAASTVLPRKPDTERGAAAARGDMAHAIIAAHLRGWEQPDIGRYRIKMDLSALETYIGDGERRCELAMAYDGRSVEVLGENIGREYGRPGKLCGSADLVRFGRVAMVLDVKTGAIPAPHPRENWQIATLSMMAALAFPEIEGVRGVIAKLDRDGSWEFSEHVYTRSDLQAVRARVDAARALWTQVDELHQSGWGADPVPSQNCRFCKCICPHADVTVFPVSQHVAV